MTAPRFADVHVTDVDRVDAQLPQAVHLDHVPTAPFAFRTHRVTRGTLEVEETRGTDGIHSAAARGRPPAPRRARRTRTHLVTAVARSWGFRPQSFVAAYGTRFGRSPGQTLRGPAFA